MQLVYVQTASIAEVLELSKFEALVLVASFDEGVRITDYDIQSPSKDKRC